MSRIESKVLSIEGDKRLIVCILWTIRTSKYLTLKSNDSSIF